MTSGKKAIFGLVCLGGAITLVAVSGHYYLRRSTERYKNTLAVRGEYLSIRQPWPKALRGDREKAFAFSQAVLQVQRGAVLLSNQVHMMHSVAFGRALIASAQPDIRNYIGATNSWEDLAGELRTNSTLLDEIRASLGGPAFDFNLYYAAGFEIPLRHLSQAYQTASIFSMAAALALHRKEIDAANTNLLTLLSLAKAFHQDRFLITELVQIAIAQLAASTTWEALQTPGWRDEELKLWQDAWSAMEFLEPMKDCFAFERGLVSDTLSDYRKTPRRMLVLSGMARNSTPGAGGVTGEEFLSGTVLAGLAAIWTYYWSYDDELGFLKITQSHLDGLRQTNGSWKSASERISSELKDFKRQYPPSSDEGMLLDYQEHNIRNFFSNMALQQEKAVRRAFGAQTLKEMVGTGIALKRYERSRGSYPSNLNALVPAFLSRLPIDFMDGQPLRYRPETNGMYTLYSVGADGVDGGGLAPKQSTRLLAWNLEDDWVWPQPANSEEVKEFEAKEAAREAKAAPRPRRASQTPVSASTNR